MTTSTTTTKKEKQEQRQEQDHGSTKSRRGGIPHPYLESKYPYQIRHHHRSHQLHDITFLEGAAIGQIMQASGWHDDGRMTQTPVVRSDNEMRPSFGRVVKLSAGVPGHGLWEMPEGIATCDQLTEMTLVNCAKIPDTVKYLSANLTSLSLSYDDMTRSSSLNKTIDMESLRPSGPIAGLCNLQNLEVDFSRSRYLAVVTSAQRGRTVASSWVDDLCGHRIVVGRDHKAIFIDRPSISFRKSLKVLKLKGLSIREDEFKRIIIDALPQFPNLEKLDLSHNEIMTLRVSKNATCKLHDIRRYLPPLRHLGLARNPTHDHFPADEKKAIVILLQTFPMLDEILLPKLNFGNGCCKHLSTGSPMDRLIFHWLTINRAGGVLVSDVDTDVVDDSVDQLPQGGTGSDSNHTHRNRIPLSLWPIVFSRCNTVSFETTHSRRKAKNDQTSISVGQVNGMFHLLRHSEALTHRLILHGNKPKMSQSFHLSGGDGDSTTLSSRSVNTNDYYDDSVCVCVCDCDRRPNVSRTVLQNNTEKNLHRRKGLFLSKRITMRKQRAYV